MAVISIVGTSGIGKSFLIKQLASLDCLPAFFEGEEGVIPKEIFDSVLEKDPIKRFEWFIGRYKKTLERAIKISNLGLDCYVDGAAITARAILAFEDEKYKEELSIIIETIDNLKSDKIILLIANRNKLHELIQIRGRESEKTEKIIDRALKIQEEFIKLAKQKKNVLVIDRSELDFANEKDLNYVKEKLNSF